MIDPKKGPSGENPNTDEFRRVFVIRVHEILHNGYQRLNAQSFCSEAEPAITGELVKEMKGFLRSLSAPEWADHFDVHDDPPINDGERKGKDRNRIDIRVDASTPRPGNSFSFEAKRLAPGHSVGVYLGEEGLGCFLMGDYAREDRDAGMVAYVQSEHASPWAKKIQAALLKSQEKYRTHAEKVWAVHKFKNGPEYVFISVHFREDQTTPLEIYHSLLLFLPSQPASAP